MIFSFAPGMRAGPFSPPKPAIQPAQSLHHEPGRFSAQASHSSALPCRRSLVQYQYLFAEGGLTMPAIWPEPPSVNRTGPFNDCAPREVVFHGVMWSSIVEMKYAGISIFDKSIDS